MDNQIKRAQAKMTFAVILRLTGTAVMALLWARTYTDPHDNLLRVYYGIANGTFRIIVGGMLFDSLLTVLWAKSKRIFLIHFGAFYFLGGIFNLFYQIDLYRAFRPGVGIFALFISSLIMLVPQLVPFLIYKIAQEQIDKAKMYSIMYNAEAEPQEQTQYHI